MKTEEMVSGKLRNIKEIKPVMLVTIHTVLQAL